MSLNEFLSVVGIAMIAAVVVQQLGVFKSSFREPLNKSLDAVYVRAGLLSWELSIAAKGADVGIKQGVYSLPGAKRRAAAVDNGSYTIL